MDIQTILKQHNTQLVLVGVGGVVLGSTVGYFVGKGQRDVVVPAIGDVHIHNGEPVVDKNLTKNDEKFEQAVAEYAQKSEDPDEIQTDGRVLPPKVIIDEASLLESIPPIEEPMSPPHNVFANSDGWNQEEEEASRSSDHPYPIHQDEYFASEKDYNQKTFTYYVGDDKLVDESENPIENYQAVVGTLRFGHGTTDPNTCYVRNEDLRHDYEILKTEEHYAHAVMGLDADTDDTPRGPEKFRDN